MVITGNEHRDIKYYSLHAEQVMSSTFFETEEGIYANELFNEALIRIKEDSKDSAGKKIVLDFARIENVSKQLKLTLSEISKNCDLLIFRNLSNFVLEQLDIEIISHNVHNVKNSEGSGYDVFYFKEASSSVSTLDEEVVFEYAFSECVKKYTTVNSSGYHQSSSVYLTKYIDVKRMISLEKPMFIYALYHLALKIVNKWDLSTGLGGKGSPILVCQNLNSSFIASVLSSLLKLDVLVLDHLGPINTMYSSLNKKIKENKCYIIVSDVVCLGTEVKIAKNLITFMGGNVYGNVSIVKVDTLQPIDQEKEELKLKSIAVFNIRKENNQGIDFQIKTALDL